MNAASDGQNSGGQNSKGAPWEFRHSDHLNLETVRKCLLLSTLTPLVSVRQMVIWLSDFFRWSDGQNYHYAVRWSEFLVGLEAAQ